LTLFLQKLIQSLTQQNQVLVYKKSTGWILWMLDLIGPFNRNELLTAIRQRN